MRKATEEFDDALNIWAHRLIGQEQIRDSKCRGHFRLGDGSAFEFGNAEGALQPEQVAHLVGLDMCAQPSGATGD